LLMLYSSVVYAQIPIDLSGFQAKNGATVVSQTNRLVIAWPTQEKEKGKLVIDLANGKPLFTSIQQEYIHKFSTIQILAFLYLANATKAKIKFCSSLI
jgi:hypothetical protein